MEKPETANCKGFYGLIIQFAQIEKQFFFYFVIERNSEGDTE